MANRQSAGILAYRRRAGAVEVFLVHPGGPFWKNKDAGAWTIPKGEFGEEESPLLAAKREFHEEIGTAIEGTLHALPSRKMRGGKTIHAWAVETDIDPARLSSNTFSMEWPPRSGRQQEFPEVDRGAWFPVADAHRMINEGQRPFIDDLMRLLGDG